MEYGNDYDRFLFSCLGGAHGCRKNLKYVAVILYPILGTMLRGTHEHNVVGPT